MYIIHPFLFALFPVLSLYRENMNIHGLPFSVIYMPSVVLIAFTALALVLLSLILRNKNKAALLVSWFLILYFAHGHLRSFVADVLSIHNPLATDVSLSVIFLAGVLAVIRIRRPLSSYAFIIAVLLVSVPTFQITLHHLSLFVTAPEVPDIQCDHKASGELPDIYYIIFDGYGRQDALKHIYGYDNSQLINYLKMKGFYVAPGSYSNYCQTALSLASSLNMRYIDPVLDGLDCGSRDRSPLSRLIKNNQVQQFLRALGYTSTALHTTYYPTQITSADEYFKPDVSFFALDKFTEQLLETTPLPFKSMNSAYRQIVLYSINQLLNLPPCPTPRFVFAHLMIPHPPFIFGPNGEPRYVGRPIYDLSEKEFARLSGDMLTFASRVMVSVVDSILARSARPPIIVIQADHGTPPQVNWEDPEHTDMPGRFCILNAYYLPEGGDEHLDPMITPVNTFRLIFNYYFGAQYERLPDRCYFSGFSHPFVFHDVTERLRGAKQPPDSTRFQPEAGRNP